MPPQPMRQKSLFSNSARLKPPFGKLQASSLSPCRGPRAPGSSFALELDGTGPS